MSANTVPLDRDELSRALNGAEWSVAAPVQPLRPAARPDLKLAPQPRARRRPSALAGALTAVALVLVVMLVQLGLSIAVSAGAYETRALQVELRDLTRVERVLAQNTAKLASPQNLADNAIGLGMVQNMTPATLRLSDGSVLGNLGGSTAAIAGNLVPNAALTGLPIVDAQGLLVDRNAQQAAAAIAAAQNAPVPWEGLLPAPQTR